MLVRDAEDDKLVLLCSVSAAGEITPMELPKTKLVQIHDNFDGGNEIAFLERC